MDEPCMPFDLSDTAALVDGLGRTRGGRGQVWLTVAPQVQPVLERKGRFGRRKEEPAGWCLAAQDWSKATEEADWTIWFAVPSGLPLARRGPGPAPALYPPWLLRLLFQDREDPRALAADRAHLARRLELPH